MSEDRNIVATDAGVGKDAPPTDAPTAVQSAEARALAMGLNWAKIRDIFVKYGEPILALADDLLKKGFTPAWIEEAIAKIEALLGGQFQPHVAAGIAHAAPAGDMPGFFLQLLETLAAKYGPAIIQYLATHYGDQIVKWLLEHLSPKQKEQFLESLVKTPAKWESVPTKDDCLS